MENFFGFYNGEFSEFAHEKFLGSTLVMKFLISPLF